MVGGPGKTLDLISIHGRVLRYALDGISNDLGLSLHSVRPDQAPHKVRNLGGTPALPFLTRLRVSV